MPTVTIDTVQVEVPAGTTILEAAAQAGVEVPTLCHLKDMHQVGACRVCTVEVEGARSLVASCVAPVADGMVIRTSSKRVRDARKSIMQLIMSDHDGDCTACSRATDCELREVAAKLGVDKLRWDGEKHLSQEDRSTPAIIRDGGKCILCRRCITACSEVQATGALWAQGRGFDTAAAPAFGQDLDTVACVQCGQCAAVCPTGSIVEASHIDQVWDALDDADKVVVFQTAPAIRAALGECFDMPVGSLVKGQMVSAIKRLGADYCFDTNFTADLTIMEEGTELLLRLKGALSGDKNVALPQFTSCCPGWINFAEQNFHELLPNLSTTKSPQQMFGTLAKTYFAESIGVAPENMYVVSVMPCTAKKYEAQRREMNGSGQTDVDAVLTTRELAAMIKQAGLDFAGLPDTEMDAPLGLSTGAADIFANTGGVMEAALRTAYAIVTGENLPTGNLHVEALAGLEGVKLAAITIDKTVPDWQCFQGVTLKVAVCHGLANAKKVCEMVQKGECDAHFIEVMSCPGGWIGGGGQPRMTDNQVRENRIAAIYAEDEGRELRQSHENPAITQLYADWLGTPCGHKSHELLHTHYHEQAKVW
ncbi:MAG: NADH-dependent [FeFe] hydrogenase, group A6 [Planctomycetota bacterium]